MLDQTFNLGLGMIRKITDLWSASKSDSLIDYTQVARVEPIVLIDADCVYLESMSDIQQSLLSIFAGYYLQAVAISTSIGKVEVKHHLDKLNPHRNPGDSAANTMGWLLAEESYRHALPVASKIIALESIAMEADENKDYKKEQFDLNKEKFEFDKAMASAKSESEKKAIELRYADRQDSLSASEIGFGRDTMQTIRELSNLSVGKMLSVEITDGLHKAVIPVAIRLMASSIPSASLIHILSHASEDNSMKERYHGWKSGRLEFIKDLCFCQDLIDAHRKNLMMDKDGIYTNILKRSRNNQLATIVSGNPTVATASNLVVISTDTIANLELKINGKMSDFKVREKVFKDTYIMLMCVVDKQWDRITIYSRGIPLATEIGIKDLKAANKGSGPDVSDILKAYRLGNNPSL